MNKYELEATGLATNNDERNNNNALFRVQIDINVSNSYLPNSYSVTCF